MWSFKLVSINFCRECTFSNFHLSSSHSASAKLVPFPLINGQIDGCLIWRLIGRRKASCGPNIWANIPSNYSPLFSFLQLSKHLERLKRWPDISFPKYTPPTAIPIHQSWKRMWQFICTKEKKMNLDWTANVRLCCEPNCRYILIYLLCAICDQQGLAEKLKCIKCKQMAFLRQAVRKL